MGIARLSMLVFVALLGVLAPMAAHGHAGHGESGVGVAAAAAAIARDSTHAPGLHAAVPVLESPSHCPTDSGGCCCRVDVGTPLDPPRLVMLAGPAPPHRAPASTALRVTAADVARLPPPWRVADSPPARAPPLLP